MRLLREFDDGRLETTETEFTIGVLGDRVSVRVESEDNRVEVTSDGQSIFAAMGALTL